MLDRHPSSFRDPSGFLFRRDGRLHRHVAPSYVPIYDAVRDAGLFDALSAEGLLIPHAETERTDTGLTLTPEPLDFVAYPYEWCFSQWKDAALLTLQLQRAALERGFTLKDATAFNVQMHRARPVFIDTLSFEPYEDGAPWVAYRQFCEHFLAPLALMALRDIRLGQLFRSHLDGIPLDLTAALLPWNTRLNPHLLAHLHIHGKQQLRHADDARAEAAPARPVSRNALLGILDSLESAVSGLEWRPEGTEWGDYYDDTNYSDAAFGAKRELVGAFLDAVTPAPLHVWDCGANTGVFSRIASGQGIFTVAWDIDPAAVEKNWRQARRGTETHLLPLVQDLTNPSPGLGWSLEERDSVFGRRLPDVALGLALVHHLAIGANVPLPQIADFFARLAPWWIVEFVPKEDSQTRRLLAHRRDIFPDYHREGFEAALAQKWTIERRAPIRETQRVLYLARRR